MTPSHFRTGAKLCAIVTLMSLAGCGDQRSILAPTNTQIGGARAVQPADINPGTEHAGSPALTLYNSDFRYTYPAGSYSTDPQTWVQLDVLAGEPVTVNWFARTRGGAHLRAYRWTLDIADLFDQTPRIDEATDLAHWSTPSATTTSATVGPFAAGEQHFPYVEVEDTNGIRSLGTVHVQVVESLAEELRRR